jgi:hypothetical protein
MPSHTDDGATELCWQWCNLCDDVDHGTMSLQSRVDDGAAESMLAVVRCWAPMVHGDPANFLTKAASNSKCMVSVLLA